MEHTVSEMADTPDIVLEYDDEIAGDIASFPEVNLSSPVHPFNLFALHMPQLHQVCYLVSTNTDLPILFIRLVGVSFVNQA
jgi:hypothetical protein